MKFSSCEEEIRHEFGEGTDTVLSRGFPFAVPTRPEVQTLLDASRREPGVHLTLRLLYATGVRVGELANWLPGDVHWEDQHIFVRGGKGGVDRYVVVDSESLRLLAAQGTTEFFAPGCGG